ncbi:abnormal spindle-like microcephaly-associated protein [Xyrichtys novacula]|uniref:Abnormal spindle-like microcephaly-associated protein n=1 Tax=Xyrichtys novacula TaxID=13765 RepID=A0AAV1FKH0_XYRNO|nr:abnormal spindle-like microcephaly-associated protein [Xyrichtys novacula]
MAETIPSTRGGFLDFSPVRRGEGNKENDVPVLSLIQFSKAPFVTFGTVKLGTSKSAVLRIENPTEDAEADVTVEKISSSKGFSVDYRNFTIQPEGSFSLTVTWTPTEEGGVRELIIFNANGVLKHQAVLLGRAEAPRKKKKSLWDTIKNKREGEKVTAPRRKKTEQPLKMAANKTFQVSRKPQYKREKPRSPLASLNEGQTVRERSLTKSNATEDHPQKPEEQETLKSTQTQRQRSLVLSDQENIHHVQRNSPLVLLVPAAKLMDSSDTLSGKLENKDIARMLNKTLSPIGTPERFKRLMPHIQSESPAVLKSVAEDESPDSALTGTPTLSLKDALALIDSDLNHMNTSPRDTSSSCDFSDSLESKSDSRPVLNSLPDSPPVLESNEPRLTFFVREVPDVSEADTAKEKPKKASFTSATVIKSKAPEEANCLSGRKIKKSRRRLLEKTLELSDSSGQSESGPGTPSLPVIDPGTSGGRNSEASGSLHEDRNQTQILTSFSPTPRLEGSPLAVTFPVSSPPRLPSARFSFSATPPPPEVLAPITLTVSSPSPLSSSSPLHHTSATSDRNLCDPSPTVLAPPCFQEELFPIHLATKSKKRKSEEFLKSDRKTQEAEKTGRIKRSRVVAARTESTRPLLQEKRRAAQKQQTSTTGSVRSMTSSSLRSMRSVAPAQAKQSSSKPTSRAPPSLKSSGAPSVKTARVVAVAQSKLTFVKPLQTAIPRHPMPFAAKNMFYDERWIEKQERGFTWWINYVLTPDEFKVNTEVKVNAVSIAMGSDDRYSVPKAPTKEEMSFSTYTARRKLNRLRRSACQLFTSEAMVKAIQRLEVEVEARRLLVRKDRHLWKDIGERRKVLNWLLSYNPLWLRIGLETIYGELISLESNSDALGLAMFILQRLLWNPDIAAEFRHAKVPHLYKDGHEEALSRFTLKKLLLLVCFLDKAKESRLIEHNPCLFCQDAEFKTSKDLLLAFSRDFLSGEGILPRHLGYLGLPVSHIQTPLDEFNFAVKNLAVDLKCGIRLVRVMELLIQDWTISVKLRLPAISRLQKVHNVDLALQVLKSKGVDLKDEHGAAIDARDIVDGHREKTLSLLWKIIFAFHVEVILNEDQLKDEIGFLKRSFKTKRRLASLKADRDFQPSPSETRTAYKHSSTKITLLMEWVRAVCDFYNLKVENFTVTFSDGRVLCYLIHHYHPGLLSDQAVSHSTTQTVECSQRGRLELDCSASDSDNSFDFMTGSNGPDSPSVEFKELLENEKNNFRLVNTAVSFLGGVPAMINPADMSNTIPNEKVVMSYLSFLCTRLLDLRNETRAARVIQGAWRKYKLKKDLQLFKERNMAAAKIQSLVRSFLQKRRVRRQNRAAVIIQSAWRGYAARNRMRLEKEAQLRALKHKAATLIQTQWRMFSTMRAYQRLRYHAIVVQAQWRMKRAASAYGRIYWAATVLQKHTRSRALGRRDRERFLSLRAAAVRIQRGYRRWKTEKTAKENHAAKVIQAAFKRWYQEKMVEKNAAAVRIQSWYRMQTCLHQYRKIKRSAVLIQARYRGRAQRRRFERLKLQHHSAAVIQSAFRGHAVRKQVERMRSAALIIQRGFRASVKRDTERRMFVRMRRAAVIIQAAYRGKVARESLRKRHKAAAAIQAAFRKYAARRRYLALRRAASLIQRKYRATLLARETKKDYDALRDAALTVQAIWRGRAVRERIEKWHHCATLIQAHYRRHRAETEFRSKKAAALVIQRRYRACKVAQETQKSYLRLRAACVTLQARFRGMRVRRELEKKHLAATVIQSSFRMFVCKKRYVLLQSAAIITQSRYRALLVCRAQRNQYRELKQAAVKIQAVYRGFRVRQDLKKRHNAARAIQAQFRMHKTRMAYLATKCAAIIIQERYRAKLLRNQQMQKLRVMKSAAVVIQAAYRGRAARKMVAKMNRAATIIQRKFFTIRDRKRFLALREAAVICQRRYRAVILARKDRLDYLSKRRAAVCLQAACRGWKVRKELRSQQAAATIIQSHFRMHQQRNSYRRLHWAANVLQVRYRANKTMRAEMDALKAKKHAAVVLQAAFRGMKSRRVIKQKHQAAALIQRAYRAHREHEQYQTLKSSILTIQRRYRATLAAREQTQKYQNMRRAAVVLQAAFRGQRVRKEVALRHQAATVIQSVFRRHKEEVKFKAMRLSAIIIQRFYRSCIKTRKDREKFLSLKKSTITLQAAARGWSVRRDMNRQKQAAVVIQSCWRCSVQRCDFQRKREAAVTLQRRVRAWQIGRQERENYSRVRRAAVVLQTHCRAWITRQQALEKTRAERRLRFASAGFHHLCAIKIQRAVRAHWALESAKRQIHSVLTVQRWVRARQQRRRYLEERRKVITAQRAAKRWLARRHTAASVIQEAVHRFLLLRRQKRVQQGIVKAQALWRGHRSRRLNDNPKVVKLRQRLRKVSAEVKEEDKLCNKTSSALDYLLRYKHFSYILEALKNLEIATRLSPECCERLVESGATNIIFTLIRCCNRSVPCMDVITFSIQILLNLSKYHKTIEAVYSVENSVETLLDLLQRYREKAGDKVADKGGSIFTKACFLLALLLQDKHRVVEVMKLPKVLDRIRSIYRLTARKQKMDAERTVIKQKMNASINGSFYVPATPRKSNPVPKFAPDWVLRKDKLKDIVDPLRAIQMVANTLSIVL